MSRDDIKGPRPGDLLFRRAAGDLKIGLGSEGDKLQVKSSADRRGWDMEALPGPPYRVPFARYVRGSIDSASIIRQRHVRAPQDLIVHGPRPPVHDRAGNPDLDREQLDPNAFDINGPADPDDAIQGAKDDLDGRVDVQRDQPASVKVT